MTYVVGVDAGNNAVKLYGSRGEMKFPSDLGEYRELKLSNTLGKDDMVFEYLGKKGFAGTLAQRESEFGGSLMGSSKAHNDMLIRVLLGLHRYTDEREATFNIIVGQPIKNHTEANKNKMKEMLIGVHDFTINDVRKTITIERAEIAAEGASAYWSSPKKGRVRLIDAGSGTVNIATIQDGLYVDKESDTLEFGLNTVISNDIDAFARRVAIACLKKWKRNDEVYLVGGNANGLLIPFMYHFPNCQTLKPQVNENGGVKILLPIYANAVAFYNIGKKVYEDVLQYQS